MTGNLDANRKSSLHRGFGNVSLGTDALLEALPAAVYTCDIEGRITFFNQSAADLWGRKPHIGIDSWCGSWKMCDSDMNPIPLERSPVASLYRVAKEQLQILVKDYLTKKLK